MGMIPVGFSDVQETGREEVGFRFHDICSPGLELLKFYDKGWCYMLITKNNLYEVVFENQDARLLIEDVVTSTSACLYYYHDFVITVELALTIWHRAVQADAEEMPYSVSFLDCLQRSRRPVLRYA